MCRSPRSPRSAATTAWSALLPPKHLTLRASRRRARWFRTRFCGTRCGGRSTPTRLPSRTCSQFPRRLRRTRKATRGSTPCGSICMKTSRPFIGLHRNTSRGCAQYAVRRPTLCGLTAARSAPIPRRLPGISDGKRGCISQTAGSTAGAISKLNRRKKN